MSSRALVRCYAALWLATLVGAGLALVGLRVISASVPHDALAARMSTALALLAHNTPVALWPLALVALRLARRCPSRARAGDVLIAGAARRPWPDRRRRPRPAPAALALSAAPAARMARARHPRRRLADRTRRLGDPDRALRRACPHRRRCLGALVGAAAIETYLAPL